MVGAGVLCAPTLGDVALILRSTLGGAGFSNFGGSVCLIVRSTLGGAPDFFRRAWNRVASCLGNSNCVSPILADGASEFVCSSASVKSAASSVARYAEDINGILV